MAVSSTIIQWPIGVVRDWRGVTCSHSGMWIPSFFLACIYCSFAHIPPVSSNPSVWGPIFFLFSPVSELYSLSSMCWWLSHFYLQFNHTWTTCTYLLISPLGFPVGISSQAPIKELGLFPTPHSCFSSYLPHLRNALRGWAALVESLGVIPNSSHFLVPILINSKHRLNLPFPPFPWTAFYVPRGPPSTQWP